MKMQKTATHMGAACWRPLVRTETTCTADHGFGHDTHADDFPILVSVARFAQSMLGHSMADAVIGALDMLGVFKEPEKARDRSLQRRGVCAVCTFSGHVEPCEACGWEVCTNCSGIDDAGRITCQECEAR